MAFSYVVSAFVLTGDLTKALKTPVEGEVPPPADLDLACVGLDAPPKALLPLGRAGPLAPSQAGGEGLIVLFFGSLLFLAFCVADMRWFFLSSRSSQIF